MNMPDDRIIGRKAIVQYLKTFIDCSSWNAVRNQKKHNGLPYDHTPNGKPYIIPRLIREWDEKKRHKSEQN